MVWTAGKSRNNELYEVWVDGIREPTAFMASVHEGWARCYVIGPGGEVDTDAFGNPKVVTKEGVVELRKVNR